MPYVKELPIKTISLASIGSCVCSISSGVSGIMKLPNGVVLVAEVSIGAFARVTLVSVICVGVSMASVASVLTANIITSIAHIAMVIIDNMVDFVTSFHPLNLLLMILINNVDE